MNAHTRANANLLRALENRASSAEHSELDELVETFTLGHRAEYLEKIFADLGLSHYYKFAVEEANVNHAYLESSRTPAYWFMITLNAYEGCRWEGLTDAETRIVLLGCLFHCMLKPRMTFQRCDALLKEGNPFDGTARRSIVRVIDNIPRPWPTGKVPEIFSKIARDAAMMIFYAKAEIVKQHFAGVYTDVQYGRLRTMEVDFFVEEQVRLARSHLWLTRWGTKKALRMNYPGAVAQAQALMLETLPAYKF